jgi:ubiquinone biosynthesis protein
MFAQRLRQLGQTIQNLQRFREIVGVFLKYGYEDLAHRLHLPRLLGLPTRGLRAQAKSVRNLSNPEKLRAAFEELGPTFVKVGQLLSSRTGTLPEEYAVELAKLQDSVAPMPFSEVEAILAEELKVPVTEVFAELRPEPLGSASIGQVHRARLLTGEDVVVKVQRPGIVKTIRTDLDILRQLAGTLEAQVEAWRHHRPTAVVDDLGRSLAKELDYTVEASHLERFAAQFPEEPTLHLPRVWRQYTTPRLLVMEFVGGTKAGDFVRSEAAPRARSEVGRRVGDLVLKQIFVHGFFHADPHPGNIQILDGNRICFLDFGMMGFLTQRERELFADLVWGLAKRDEVGATHALLRLAADESEPVLDTLESDVAGFMHRQFPGSLREVRFDNLIKELVELCNRHRLRLPLDLLLMLKAFGQMESLVKALNPDHDLIAQATPFLKQARLARLKPRRLADSLLNFGQDFADFARTLPGDLRGLMARFKAGEARLIMRHDGLEPLQHSLDQVTNRVAFAIVLAALIVSNALIIHSRMPPLWHGIPVIGLFGFMVTGVLGLWLLWSIIRHGRM